MRSWLAFLVPATGGIATVLLMPDDIELWRVMLLIGIPTVSVSISYRLNGRFK